MTTGASLSVEASRRQTARYPPVSVPASRFGPFAAPAPGQYPWARMPQPAGDRLDIVCLRPIHHVLEFAAVHRLTAALRQRLPGSALHLHVLSALRDPAPFALLPVDRVSRIAGRFGRGVLAAGLRRLAGRSSTPVAVLAPPAGWRRPGAADPGRGGWPIWPVPLGFATLAGAEDGGTERGVDDLDHGSEDAARGFAEGQVAGAGAAGDSGLAAAGAHFLRAVLQETPLWRTAAGAPPHRSPRTPGQRVLIHQARFHLGDTLWLTPLLAALQARLQRPAVTVVGPPVAAQVLAGNPDLDELICYQPGDGEDGRRAVRAALAGRRFDAALFAFARRHESAWLAQAMAAAGVPRRVNLEYHDLFQDSRRPHAAFTHEGWFFWGSLPSPRLLLHAADPLAPVRRGRPPEATEPAPAPVRLAMQVPAAARRVAGELLAAGGAGGLPYAVIAPGGQSSVPWPAAAFARLAAALGGEFGLAVVVEGSPDEAALLATIAATVAGASPPILVRQDPLDILAALIERARLLVGNDSGPLHMAAALGVPSLYFSPHEKLAHSHPEGPAASWALYDDEANDPRRITVEQALGALRAMRRQGLLGPSGKAQE